MKDERIKLGVSLYSYQDEFFRRDMTLKDCIEAVSDMGASGIEILPEEMIRDCFHLTDAFVDDWFSWMEEYHTVPVAVDGFCDEKGLWKKAGHVPSLEEAVAVQKRYVDVAARLGCKYVRTQIRDMDLLRAMIPYAEDKNVILALEIHAPGHVRDQINMDWLNVREQTGTRYLGFIPDFGIYEHKATPIIMRQCIRDGATAEIWEEAEEKKAMGWGWDEMKAYFEPRCRTSGDMDAVWRVYNVQPDDPKDLLEIMPYVVGFHGKFWNMLEDLTEESVDYAPVLKVIHDAGFRGYINSEYEGGRHMQDTGEVRGVEQVRRHHAMMRNILEKL
ncbi:MAG: sugar phosphate isomerase/epimerase [Lachnospiraceae bacterium]|jgi:sugar phosphate isomerase/epimerase|nr:sugar phosphate isomerase/epimerase [Lachnospiraceae bacterium]